MPTDIQKNGETNTQAQWKDECSCEGRENPSRKSPQECSKGKHAGLYLHIPFCRSKCRYCNFFSVADEQKIPEFLTALFQETRLRRNTFKSYDTLYIGGGTPSILAIDQLADLLTHLRQDFRFSEDAEMTLECNPADVDVRILKQLHSLGINRLNIGVQSFDNEVLSFLGRRHDSTQALQSIFAARQAGFDNFGIDLIYGIPRQSQDVWKKTLRQALSLNIPHLSCYQLTLETDTPLGRAYGQRLFVMPDHDELFDLFMNTSKSLEDSGYIHYEVSNFSHGESRMSRHNSKYWHHVPYLGLGPAAHSFDGNNRWKNIRSLEGYLQQLEQSKSPIEDCESLTIEELQLETLFLGFRTKAGIDLDEFEERFGFDLLKIKKDSLEPILAAGHLKITAGRLKPTRTGMALADSLALI